MQLTEFISTLRKHPDSALLFVFDDGEVIPPDFHITEIGHVVKNFIDCGGTRRKVEACVLQAWVAANDPEHRLNAGKLLSIFDLTGSVLPTQNLDLEVEYENCVLSQYRVTGVEVGDGILRFALEDKHTDCLAKEACGLEGCGSSFSEKKCC